MKSILLTVSAAVMCFGLAFADATSTSSTLPASTDASSYLDEALGATPTWATGAYATSLATALYSLETSFYDRSDFTSIRSDLYSAASQGNGAAAAASLHDGHVPIGITTEGWFTNNVPKAVQTEVVNYASAWKHAVTSVEAQATATENAAAPRCTGMAIAGVALGVAAVVGVV